MNTNKIAWFNCFSGIAGDMALGALVDAGADIQEIKNTIAKLHLPDWELKATNTQRNGIAATKIDVLYDASSPIRRTADQIFELLQNADIPPRVKQRSKETFIALAKAESKLHGNLPGQIDNHQIGEHQTDNNKTGKNKINKHKTNKPQTNKPQTGEAAPIGDNTQTGEAAQIGNVHFHEVGSMDAIIDIVGTCAALENLQVDVIYSSPVANGIGNIECDHGVLPNPPPAVVELLMGAPVFGVDVPYELTTPTGAALLSALSTGFGALPEMHLQTSGFGAGTREFSELPNLTQVLIGAPVTANSTPHKGQPVMVVETNLDDITGEVLADTIERLLSAGAYDAWATPIVMKKGRPAHTLSVLIDAKDLPVISDLIIEMTGTLGVRAQTLQRWPQPRSTQTIQFDGYEVRFKSSVNGKIKAEYDDLSAIATATGKPLKEIQTEVQAKIQAEQKKSKNKNATEK